MLSRGDDMKPEAAPFSGGDGSLPTISPNFSIRQELAANEKIRANRLLKPGISKHDQALA